MKRPMGVATVMAIRAISSVPRNTGTAPKAPAPATCSARMAICGSHRRPKKKSAGGTSAKKAQASQSSETTMPTVVKIATTEQNTMKPVSARSTLLRARNRGERRARARKRPASMSASATTNIATCAIPVHRTSRAAAALTSGLGSEKIRPAATLWISESSRRDWARVAPALSASGRLRSSRPSMTLPWRSSQSRTRTSAGTADPDGDERAVIARQRVHRRGVGTSRREAARGQFAHAVGGGRQQQDRQEEVTEQGLASPTPVEPLRRARPVLVARAGGQLNRSILTPSATSART